MIKKFIQFGAVIALVLFFTACVPVESGPPTRALPNGVYLMTDESWEMLIRIEMTNENYSNEAEIQNVLNDNSLRCKTYAIIHDDNINLSFGGSGSFTLEFSYDSGSYIGQSSYMTISFGLSEDVLTLSMSVTDGGMVEGVKYKYDASAKVSKENPLELAISANIIG